MIESLFKSKLDLVDTLFSSSESAHPLIKNYDNLEKSYSDRTYLDLEIFKDYEGNDTNTVLSTINQTKTLSGYLKLQNMLMIEQDHNYLQRKYKMINNNFENVNNIISECANYEKTLLIYTKNDDKLNDMLTNVQISMPYVNKLNDNDLFMNLYNNYHIFNPIVTILSPIVFFILTLLFSKYIFFKYIKYMMFNVPTIDMFSSGSYFSGILTLAMYFYTLYTSVSYSLVNQKLLKKMFNINSHVKKLQDSIVKLAKYFDDEPKKYVFLTGFYDRNYNITLHKGKIINDFFRIKKNISIINDILEKLGIIDAYTNIVKLVKNNNYCYTKIINSKPTVYAKDCYLPNLTSNIVKNTLILKQQNIIVTGANAQGKSTLLKSIAVSLLLSQQLGIAPAKSFIHSRFKNIDTYLNVYDKKGEKSFYETELEIMKDYIDKLENSKGYGNYFIVIDEIFSGTNPEDAIEASKQVAKKINSFENNMALITTHHRDLNKLNDYKQFHMDNYKLIEGTSEKSNGLEMLKDKFKKNI